MFASYNLQIGSIDRFSGGATTSLHKQKKEVKQEDMLILVLLCLWGSWYFYVYGDNPPNNNLPATSEVAHMQNLSTRNVGAHQSGAKGKLIVLTFPLNDTPQLSGEEEQEGQGAELNAVPSRCL